MDPYIQFNGQRGGASVATATVALSAAGCPDTADYGLNLKTEPLLLHVADQAPAAVLCYKVLYVCIA